jgi:hypothetical protein
LCDKGESRQLICNLDSGIWQPTITPIYSEADLIAAKADYSSSYFDPRADYIKISHKCIPEGMEVLEFIKSHIHAKFVLYDISADEISAVSDPDVLLLKEHGDVSMPGRGPLLPSKTYYIDGYHYIHGVSYHVPERDPENRRKMLSKDFARYAYAKGSRIQFIKASEDSVTHTAIVTSTKYSGVVNYILDEADDKATTGSLKFGIDRFWLT